MRYREPFTVFPRKTSNKRTLWYYRTYDEDGNRTSARSTGQTSKSAARAYCRELEKQGMLRPTKDITFQKYAEGWWIYETCPYIQGKLARGHSFARNTAKIRQGIMKNHLLPGFGKKKLKNIKPKDIESWLLGFLERGVSSSAANNNYKVLQIMLNEAERLRYISKSPCFAVKPLKKTVKGRTIFTRDEAKKLFNHENKEKLWDYHINYTASLLSATSGMRLGEVQGLQVEDIHDPYVHVHRNLERGGFGLKDTKNHGERMIPLPEETLKALRKLTKDRISGFVFSLDDGKSAVAATTITKGLYKALRGIGITEEARMKRNLTFHAWRHYFNSRLRSAGIPDSKIQSLTGHKTLKMTEHYTHFSKEDYDDILQAEMW